MLAEAEHGRRLARLCGLSEPPLIASSTEWTVRLIPGHGAGRKVERIARNRYSGSNVPLWRTVRKSSGQANRVSSPRGLLDLRHLSYRGGSGVCCSKLAGLRPWRRRKPTALCNVSAAGYLVEGLKSILADITHPGTDGTATGAGHLHAIEVVASHLKPVRRRVRTGHGYPTARRSGSSATALAGSSCRPQGVAPTTIHRWGQTDPLP